MKVILLQDVARIGRRFETKDVPDGHALNFLIPRGMAQPASKENMKNLEVQKSKSEGDRAHAEEVFKETCEKLMSSPIVLKLPANEQGHLFKGVKAEEIAECVTKEVGLLKKEQIILKSPIKNTGEHTITAVSGGEEQTFTLVIEAE